jgi:hypothetical protein
MYDSAGVTIVSSPEIGIWDQGEEWTPEDEVRTGVQEGPSESQFGLITGLGVLEDGRIVRGDARVRDPEFYSAGGQVELRLPVPGGIFVP